MVDRPLRRSSSISRSAVTRARGRRHGGYVIGAYDDDDDAVGIADHRVAGLDVSVPDPDRLAEAAAFARVLPRSADADVGGKDGKTESRDLLGVAHAAGDHEGAELAYEAAWLRTSPQ